MLTQKLAFPAANNECKVQQQEKIDSKCCSTMRALAQEQEG